MAVAARWNRSLWRRGERDGQAAGGPTPRADAARSPRGRRGPGSNGQKARDTLQGTRLVPRVPWPVGRGRVGVLTARVGPGSLVLTRMARPLTPPAGALTCPRATDPPQTSPWTQECSLADGETTNWPALVKPESSVLGLEPFHLLPRPLTSGSGRLEASSPRAGLRACDSARADPEKPRRLNGS
jgi:hypothetical protein